MENNNLPPLDNTTEVRLWHASNYRVYTELSKKAEEVIRKLLQTYAIPVINVYPRVKEIDSLLEKLTRKKDYKSILDCTDLCGCRIVCLTNTQVDDAIDMIRSEFEVLEEEWRKPEGNLFGYKSYHFTLRFKPECAQRPEYQDIKDLKFELQIRTAFQEGWAALDHKVKYKPPTPPSEDVQHRIDRIAALIELADEEWQRIYDITFKKGSK